MRTLIKNGTVVTATDQYKGDILVEDEKISAIGTALDMHADKVIDAAGKYVLPGGHRRAHPPRYAVWRRHVG
jgi:dihydropyrimidinase